MDMTKMMQQAKQMQDRMMKMQHDLGQEIVVGESGGGLVKATMTCKGEMKGIEISPEAIDPTDPSILEDLVVAAVNDAKAKADQMLADRTKKMMESMGLPGDIQLPF